MKEILAFIYYNTNERSSLIFLLVFIFIVIISIRRIKQQYQPKSVDFSYYDTLFIKEPISKVLPDNHTVKKVVNIPKFKSYKKEDVNERFIFDPNTISLESLILLGLGTYASNNLVKYRNNGGRFYNKEDLKKIYGVSDELYLSLKDYISIESKRALPNPLRNLKADSHTISHDKTKKKDITSENEVINKTKSKPLLIDINTADEVQLQYIKGIGPTYARRIMKYRDLIGGFHSKDQLLEVYGLDEEKFNEIKHQISLSNKVTELNINSLNYSQLSRHPYISYQEAKLIVAYHRKHGPYKNVYDITKIGVMDSNFVNRIIPYIPDSLNHKAQTQSTSL